MILGDASGRAGLGGLWETRGTRALGNLGREMRYQKEGRGTRGMREGG